MKKLAAFVLAALLLAGCAPAEPEETTTAPTTQATTAPTTEPVTEPTAAPTTEATTEATEPVQEFTASLWRMEPEYLSYKAYFSQDRPYIKEQVNGWAVTRGDTGYFIELHADSALRISCRAFEETYTVPGSGKTLQDYGGPQLLGTDGKYAYLASDTHIVRVELLTGAVTELVSSGKFKIPTSATGWCYITSAMNGAHPISAGCICRKCGRIFLGSWKSLCMKCSCAARRAAREK